MRFEWGLPRARVLSVRLIALVTLVAALATTAGLGCYSKSEGASASAAACDEATASRAIDARVRRLTDAELSRALGDLVGEPVAVVLARDPLVGGFDDDATALIVSGPKLDGYVDLARAIAPKLAAHPSATCDASEPSDACTFRFADRIARRLYGRPLRKGELARLTTFGTKELVAQAMLLSPYALYRTEVGDEDASSSPTVRLSGFETASALSFLVTGTRPSDALLAAAERGELESGEGRAQWARALLASEDARAPMRRFVRQWLGVGDLTLVRKDADLFPEWNRDLQHAMSDELDRFVDDVVWASYGSFSDLFLHARQASDYGDARGVLSMPAFLATHATREGTNPVARGVIVRARIFCQTFGEPPRAALDRPIDFRNGEHTTREKFEIHSKDPECASCHSRLDPVGFGFESYDALGHFRTEERGKPVDGHGMLDGTDVDGPFEGPAALSDKVAQSALAHACFAGQLQRFAMGIGASCARPEIAAAVEHGSVVDALVAIVAHPSFVERTRAERP